MTERHLLTARIDPSGGPEPEADQVFVPWWSFTKTVLAVASLRLVAQGYCGLDDQFEGRSYSLRHLLQHRAGVPNYGDVAAYHEAVRRGDEPWSLDDMLVRVRADRLDFTPGQGWRYSNVGYLFIRQFIEKTFDRDIGSALQTLVFDAVGLRSVRVAASKQDLADTAWGNAGRYDPAWVYHGLLIGTPGDAARFLHRLVTGELLPPALLSEMTTPVPVGEHPLAGRPWQTTGYGLGLMIGRMGTAGIAIGHSGASPMSVSAVYHFRDLPTPCTAAAFARGGDEGIAEHEAVRLARLR